jgi:hypothetical protein
MLIDLNKYKAHFEKKMKTKDFLSNGITINIVANSQIFDEMVENLREIFETNNCKVVHSMELIPGNYDIYLIINPLHGYSKQLPLLNRTALYAAIQTEQLNNPIDKGFFHVYMNGSNKRQIRQLKYYDRVFEIKYNDFIYLQGKINNVTYFPIGVVERSLMKYSIENKKYDLFFVGTVGSVMNRRTRLLEKLKKKYNVYPRSENLFGEDLANAISQSKICLNIHFDYSSVFEPFRIFDYISYGGFVLSEFVSNPHPLISGIHFDTFNTLNIEKKIDYYLSNIDAIAKISNDALILSKQYTRDRFSESVLSTLLVDLNDKSINKRKSKFILFIRRISIKLNRALNP